jgi:putative flippase GtrA
LSKNSGLRIGLLYALFALIATAANFATQMLVVRLYDGPWAISLAVLAGTVVGLPVKYVLDKKWIFAYTTTRASQHVNLFALYTATAVVTTLVFWGFEALFEVLYRTEAMRLVGGAIGLAIGYASKYLLDRHFVFRVSGSDERGES